MKKKSEELLEQLSDAVFEENHKEWTERCIAYMFELETSDNWSSNDSARATISAIDMETSGEAAHFALRLLHSLVGSGRIVAERDGKRIGAASAQSDQLWFGDLCLVVCD